MYHFCTYFDRNYLSRGIALYQSVARCVDKFTFWVLCFDTETEKILEALMLPGVFMIGLEEFEAEDPELLAAKVGRKTHEYMWTCTPSLLLHVMGKRPEVETLTYLDADLLMYRDVQPIVDELGDGSILLVEHGYSRSMAHLASTTGIFNVGLMMFRNDAQSRSSLLWWRDRCLEWCFDIPEDGRFGDQKYLDDWPQRFPGVRVLRTKGGGLAPWNLADRHLTPRDGSIYVDSDELVFYHFHSLKIFTRSFFGLTHPSYSITRSQVDLLYVPYIRELQSAIRLIQGVDPGFRLGCGGLDGVELARSLRHRKLIFVPAAGRVGDFLVRLQLGVGVVR